MVYLEGLGKARLVGVIFRRKSQYSQCFFLLNSSKAICALITYSMVAILIDVLSLDAALHLSKPGIVADVGVQLTYVSAFNPELAFNRGELAARFFSSDGRHYALVRGSAEETSCVGHWRFATLAGSVG